MSTDSRDGGVSLWALRLHINNRTCCSRLLQARLKWRVFWWYRARVFYLWKQAKPKKPIKM